MSRFSRQIDLIGEENQKKLELSKVLVIGSGGLGSPLLLSLMAAGIKTIGIIDYDVVDESNLNRQIIHDEANIGKLKTLSASHRLKLLNHQLVINAYDIKLNKDEALKIFNNYDIIVDCVDNYETRKVVSEVACYYNKTVIEAGIEEYYGFVQIIIPGKTACFNCLKVKSPTIIRQVLGAATGVVGNIQALECIKQLIHEWNGEYSYISIDLKDLEINKLYINTNDHCNCSK